MAGSMKRGLFALLLLVLPLFVLGVNEVSFTACVVDAETGRPLAGVRVLGWFNMNYGWAAVLGSDGPNYVHGITGTNGTCELRGITNLGEAGFRIDGEVPGFLWRHRSTGCRFKDKDAQGNWKAIDRKLTIQLSKSGVAVPLLVDKVVLYDWTVGSKGDEQLQFDLMEGDWLPPYGKGLFADIEFVQKPLVQLPDGRGEFGSVRRSRSELVVRFTGEDNGLVEKEAFPWAGFPIIEAPADGYQKEFCYWRQTGQDGGLETNEKEARAFCFRMRSKRNEAGEIVEANYGKIYGDFQPVNSGAIPWSGMMFTYYVNTNNLDRGLLFDTSRNLRHSRWGDNFPQ